MADYNLTAAPVVDHAETDDRRDHRRRRARGDAAQGLAPPVRVARGRVADARHRLRPDVEPERTGGWRAEYQPPCGEARSLLGARPHLPARLRSRRSRILLFLGLLGPGLIAANAGNDAGGIATYSSVGAKYGYSLLWAMVLITISLVMVQRAAARMGVGHRQGPRRADPRALRDPLVGLRHDLRC